MVESDLLGYIDFIQERVNEAVSYEQILVDQLGYQADTYGKWVRKRSDVSFVHQY